MFVWVIITIRRYSILARTAEPVIKAAKIALAVIETIVLPVINNLIYTEFSMLAQMASANVF